MTYGCDITIDTRLLRGGGIGTYLKAHMPYICKKFKVVQIGEEIVAGVPHVKCTSPLFSISEQITLSGLIKKNKPRMHFHPTFTIPLLYHGRIVTVIHDVFHLANPQFLPNYAAWLYARFMLAAAVRRSDALVTVSHFQENEIIKHLKAAKNKIHVIHNGVRDIFTRKVGSKDTEVLRKHNLPLKYMLYLGNVKPHKNINRLIESVAKVENIHLVIVGERERFITKARGLDELIRLQNISHRVHFTGYVDDSDLPVIYSCADVLIFPSLYEGFGLPPLEAMACGTLAIASQCQLSDEIYGDAYVPVDPYSVNDISEKMRFALAGGPEVEEYRRRGLERAKMFTWDRASEALLKVFDDVLGR